MKQIALLLLALSSTATARTLLDTRLSPETPAFSPAVKKQVIGDLMRWPTNKVCADASVQDMATGFFTQKAAKETVYIVQDCNNQTGPADGLNGKYWRMALYRGGKLQQVLTNAGNNVGNMGDINGDGLDDLVFLAYYRKEGESDFAQHRGATFFTFVGGKFRRLLDLDEVLAMECGSAGLGDILAYRVSISSPAAKPTFTIEQFKNKDQNCDANTPNDYTLLKKWTLRGK